MIGRSAGQAIKSSSNIGIGNYALSTTTTGTFNVAVGNATLERNTTGGSNTAIGQSVMELNTIGENNTSIGRGSMTSNTTGSNNTVIGSEAGKANTTGSNNTYIGAFANTSSGTISNSTAIGNGAIVSASNTIQLGNSSITDIKTSGILTASGYKTPTGTSSQYLMADGSVSSGTSSTTLSNIPKYVSDFSDYFYGLWENGYVTESKEKVITDKKFFTKLEREFTKKKRRPNVEFSGTLWRGGTFSHSDGIMKNSVWLDGAFDKGTFKNSSFNPYVSYIENSNFQTLDGWEIGYSDLQPTGANLDLIASEISSEYNNLVWSVSAAHSILSSSARPYNLIIILLSCFVHN
jgi:hypothetical protein